jgi:hypothetical protein
VIRLGGRKIGLAALVAGSGCALGCDGVVDPPPCGLPIVASSSVASNPNNVLSAIVRADVQSADSVVALFGRVGEAMEIVTPAVRSGDELMEIPLFGLHDITSYNIYLVAFNSCGATAGAVLPFATGALPDDLPKYVGGGPDPSPGYVVFAAGRYGLVIDNTGRVVWYHRFPNGPGLNFQAQPNGRYTARPSPATPGDKAQWVEIDPLGKITRTLGCARDLTPRVHDMIAEADGSYWLMCDEIRTVDLSKAGGAPQSLVLGTGVQHVSVTGDVLFDWTPFDHFEVDLAALEPGDRTGSPINWTHGNAIDLDSDGNLLVSFRNLSEVTKINTRTGAVVWRLGGSRNQFTFENVAAPSFARQHGVRATGAGRLMLLDNLGDPLASRAERYEYDEARRTVRQSSSYASSTGAIAQIGGTTQSLPGGRMLVSFGNGGSVEESDAAGNITWRLEGNPGYVFRAQRIRSLYQPGVGDPR